MSVGIISRDAVRRALQVRGFLYSKRWVTKMDVVVLLHSVVWF